jgi:hypothetical protein
MGLEKIRIFWCVGKMFSTRFYWMEVEERVCKRGRKKKIEMLNSCNKLVINKEENLFMNMTI